MHLHRHRFVTQAAALTAAVGIASALTVYPAIRSAHAAAAAKKQDNPAAKPVTLSVFRGQVGSDANVQLGAWGSGAAEASKDAVLNGTDSIKVTTDGLYAGARLDFPQPIDLGDAFANPHTYLRFQVRFTGQNTTAQGYNPDTLQATAHVVSPFRTMRYLLVMADGSQYELIRPVDLPPTEDPDAWTPLSFPLQAITKQLPAGKTLTGDGARLKSLAVFGDRYAQFLIGEINVLTDETEISVAPLDDQIAFANTPVAFVASAEGGASTLRYSWDFDASDGIQEDAVGRTGYHVFPRSPDSNGGQKKYTITLTVSDIDGIKKPQTVTQELTVND